MACSPLRRGCGGLGRSCFGWIPLPSEHGGVSPLPPLAPRGKLYVFDTELSLLLFGGELKLKPNRDPAAEVFPNVKGFDFSLLKMLLTDSDPNTNFGGETTAFVGVSEVLDTSEASTDTSVESTPWFRSVLSLVVSSNTATAILPHGDSFGVLAREERGVIRASLS
uniref:Uncharacterized protein n=1 Tax=Sphenodon punctatus TaxID=8508 RepID=A0A8D0G8K6_SPHPU